MYVKRYLPRPISRVLLHATIATLLCVVGWIFLTKSAESTSKTSDSKLSSAQIDYDLTQQFTIGAITETLTFSDAVSVGIPIICTDTVTPGGPNATGWDVDTIILDYERNIDRMHVSISAHNGIPVGDVDGDGDPDTTHPCLASSGGTDTINFAGTESVSFYLDNLGDGVWDFAVGIPNFVDGVVQIGDLSTFTISHFDTATASEPGTLVGAHFSSSIPSIGTTTVTNAPSAANPDFEFYIDSFAQMMNGSTRVAESAEYDILFDFLVAVGSYEDSAFGEDIIDVQRAEFPNPNEPTAISLVGQSANDTALAVWIPLLLVALAAGSFLLYFKQQASIADD